MINVSLDPIDTSLKTCIERGSPIVEFAVKDKIIPFNNHSFVGKTL
jgi:hypothetical protein